MANITGTLGNDTLFGTINDDIILGLDGNDVVSAGAGNDTVFGGNGKDRLDGGTGNDVLVGLTDDDVLLGSSGNDTLDGGDGNDLLNGQTGNDTLNGGSGNDALFGGFGIDRMTGGTGSDVFDFNLTLDSGTGVGNRDIITDFVRGVDKIDLSTIDANTSVAGNQAFTFVGNAATGAGQVGFFVSGVTGNLVIRLDVDGGADDMNIELQGVTTVSAADFIL